MRASDWLFASCPLPFPTKVWRVKIVGAADGDTWTIYRDKGGWELVMEEVRGSDIDTYEMRQGDAEHRAKGSEARAFFLAAADGKWAYLHTRLDPDKYGRILGTLEYLAEDGTLHSITAELRAAGFEKPKADA